MVSCMIDRFVAFNILIAAAVGFYFKNTILKHYKISIIKVSK